MRTQIVQGGALQIANLFYNSNHYGLNRWYNERRKFRSQTSDNMDRWKAEVVRVKEEKRREGKGREEKRREEERRSQRESLRRKKIQVPEKVGKSRNTVFFQWCVAPEGRKVGSLKRRVRSQLARWEMNNCTPLWREAHFEVKSVKNWRVRTTFGSWDVEKVVSQNCCVFDVVKFKNWGSLAE